MPPRTALVAADVIHPLRRAVLRPGQPMTAARLAFDAVPGVFHVAGYDDEGGVVACVSFGPVPFPAEDPTPGGPTQPALTLPGGDPGQDGWWQLRGMATDPAVRGQGYGAAVLRRGLEEVAARGGRAVWCNARQTAVGFYRAHGFVVVSNQFSTDYGPHHRMVYRYPAAP